MVSKLQKTKPPARRRGLFTLSANSPMGIKAAAYSTCTFQPHGITAQQCSAALSRLLHEIRLHTDDGGRC